MSAVLWAAATLEGKGLPYIRVEFSDKGMYGFCHVLVFKFKPFKFGLLFHLNEMHTLQSFLKTEISDAFSLSRTYYITII